MNYKNQNYKLKRTKKLFRNLIKRKNVFLDSFRLLKKDKNYIIALLVLTKPN